MLVVYLLAALVVASSAYMDSQPGDSMDLQDMLMNNKVSMQNNPYFRGGWGMGRGGRRPSHHHHHHHHHFRPPPFLRNVTAEARRDFWKIVKDRTLTHKEMGSAIEAWAKKQGPEIVKAVHAYEAKIMKRWKEIDTKITSTLDSLPDAYKKVRAILQDPDLTPRQEMEKLKALKLDPIVARSLRAVYLITVHSRTRPATDMSGDLGMGAMGSPFGPFEDKDAPAEDSTETEDF